MAKSLNTFVKSKMNRDLDARLVPNGEYREGRNINISKSEGSDVGALENVRGNEEIIKNTLDTLQDAIGTNNELKIIGLFKHDETSSLYIFTTSWVDNSSDMLSRGYQGYNYVIRIGVKNGVYSPQILLKGRFLNFSKNHRILGFNIVENQMFWTDNRNQPRKINIEKAGSSEGPVTSEPNHQTDYYYCEDQISVAKFAPYEAIKFLKNTGGPNPSIPGNAVWEETWVSENEEWLPIFLTAPMTGLYDTNDGIQFGSVTDAQNPGPQANKSQWAGNIEDYIHKGGANVYPQVRIRNASRPNGGTFYLYDTQVSGGGTSQIVSISDNKTNPTAKVNVPTSWLAGDLITFELRNPQFQVNTQTEKEYLKDKFVRFSYRFKYEDNEYSLMAPFTQPLFVPKRYGNFTQGDEAKAALNTDLAWFENLISSAGLNIMLPQLNYAFGNDALSGLNFMNRYKVKEIQILLKTSTNNNVYAIDNLILETQNFNRDSNNSLCRLVRNTYPDGWYPGSQGWPYNAQFLYTYQGNKPFQVLPERDVTRVSDATPVKALAQEVGANRVMYGNYQNSHGAPASLNYECFVTPKLSDYNSGNNPPISSSNETTVKEYYSGTLKQGRTYQVGVVLSDRYGRQSQVILANNEVSGAVDKDKSTVYAPYGLGIHNGVDGYYGDSLKVSFDKEIPYDDAANFYPGIYNYQINNQGEGTLAEGQNPLGWYSYKIVIKQTEQEYYNVYLPGALSGNVKYTKPDEVLTYTDVYDVTNISLFGDNINKIPKNTANLAPTDVIFNSETSLTYRVIQQVYDNNNITNNAFLDKPKKFPVVNIQQWSTFGPWTSKKGQQLAYPGPVTTPSTSVNNVDALYNVDKNPFVAAVDITPLPTLRIGFAETNQEQGNFSKFLMVAETNPVESDLDIYWETTTTGLIEDLNVAIAAGNTTDGAKGISPFLWEFQEQYPYDGIGVYPGQATITAGKVDTSATLVTGAGAWLLQQDLKVIQNNGNPSTSSDALIQITDVTSSVATSGQNAQDQFELVQTQEAGVAGALHNAWNIRLANLYASDGAYVDKAEQLQLVLQGTLTFQFLVTLPSGVPLTTVASSGNNNITNNSPAYLYVSKGSWGDSPKPDPTNVANVLTGVNASFIQKSLMLANKKVLMSPFIPLNKSQPYASGSGPHDRWWNGQEFGWSLSIKGGSKAGNVWGGTGTDIGYMFYKSGGEWKVSNLNTTGNSAVRMNEFLSNVDNQVGLGQYAQLGWDFRFNNGSFGSTSNNVVPYIRKCELAVFNNTTSWDTWAASGIGDQGATPIKGWKDFELAGTSADGNGPHLTSDGKKYGYYKFPFDIAVPNSTNSPANYTYFNTNFNAYTAEPCLLVDRFNPPFCQFGSKHRDKFRPWGSMANRDICVYKLHIGLKELWTGGLIQTDEQVVYVKLYQ